MTPTLRGMTVPVIKSFAFGVILEEQKFTSVNDSEALMTADNNTVIWATTKQDCGSAALGLKTSRNYLPVNWHIIKQGILNVVVPANPPQNNRE